MQTYDMTSFFGWFFNQINMIVTRIVNIITGINLYNDISLGEFLLAIIILGGVLPILISGTNRIRIDKQKESKNVQKSRKRN